MADSAHRISTGAEGQRKRPLLILVDSDATQLYYTGILLQRLDYTIYTTRTAEEALEIIAITIPTVIITETSLPGMSGLELLKRVKRNPATSSIPVIILTSSAGPLIRDNFVQEGCAGILVKPIDPEILYAAIQKATEVTPRSYVRLKICLDVLVGDEPAPAGTGTGECITALSENGMYVNTPDPRKRGATLPFTIFLGTARIQVKGIVLYSFDRGKGPLRTSGMGIKFVHINPDDQAMIRMFIRKALTEDLKRGK